MPYGNTHVHLDDLAYNSRQPTRAASSIHLVRNGPAKSGFFDPSVPPWFLLKGRWRIAIKFIEKLECQENIAAMEWFPPDSTTMFSVVQPNIVRIPTDKTRTIQVIGAGASRTGTMSMALALEYLCKGPCHHGGTELALREDAYVKKSLEFMRKRHDKPVMMKLLRELTAGFVAITDTPGCSFVPELLELYPDAKVVLVTRDPKRWFDSFSVVLDTWVPWYMKLVVWPCPSWRYFPDLFKENGARERERLVGPDGVIPTGGEILERHNEWVIANTPKEKLLVMELKEGWEPLCRFLDKPVPDIDFPRVNDSEALAGVVQKVLLVCLASWTGVISAGGLTAWGLYKLARGYVF